MNCRILVSSVLAIGLWSTQTVSAIEIDVTYVKTLGQTNTTSDPLKGTGRRQLAVDAQGNVIVTVVTGHPWTAIVKVGPNGRVIWETNCGGYADVPVTVAEDYVYATCPGYVLRRYSLATGKMDEAWGYSWEHDKPDIRGVKKFETASGIAVTRKYVFVSDRKNKLIRRFDRATSAEKPLAAMPAIDEPLDLAVSKAGNLLVLTAKSVSEFDPNGTAVHAPLISGLNDAQGLEVDAFTGDVFVSQGGAPGKLVNQISQYSSEGKATGAKFGKGGDFNGLWQPDAFAFSSGNADFAIDSSGGIWVNNGLGQLVHFTSAPDFRHDRTFMACPDHAYDIAADSDLNVYLTQGQGQYKLSWNGDVVWTCHIWPSGDEKVYPGCYIYGWPVYIAYAGKKPPLFYPVHAKIAYSLSPETGKLVGQIHRSEFQQLIKMTSVGEQLFAGGGEADHWKIATGTHESLPKLTPFLTPPAEFKASLLAVSNDKSRTYLWGNDRIICLNSQGKGEWFAPCPASYGRYVQPSAMLGDDVLFVPGPDHELLARDARTGKTITTIGEKEVLGRPAISRVKGLAVASKEGENYLFVLCNHQIQVFEITVRK